MRWKDCTRLIDCETGRADRAEGSRTDARNCSFEMNGGVAAEVASWNDSAGARLCPVLILDLLTTSRVEDVEVDVRRCLGRTTTMRMACRE